MELHFEDLRLKAESNSFIAYTYETQTLPFYMHYHPEYELVYIEKGNGQSIIGEHFGHFFEGALMLFAPNVPHAFSGDEACYKSTVIQFSEKFVQHLASFGECSAILQLITSVQGALLFDSKRVETDLKQISQLTGLPKLLCLLQLLNTLSCQSSEKVLAPVSHFSRQTEHRINNVCRYIHQHIHQPLELSVVASLIFLSESAFCKFFKKTTGTTFTDYVNKARIEAVSYQLIYTDLPIAQISTNYGYESQTYFNRVFKRIKGCSPMEFRRTIKNIGVQHQFSI